MADIDIVCDDCGSNNLSCDRVTGYWNVPKQEWEYDHYDSEMYCSHCGDNGRSDEIEYFPERWKREPDDFEIGDTVKFEKDIRAYSELTGSKSINDITEHTLALVVEDKEDGTFRSKSWNDPRNTVLVRLFTGELLEVWPRDIYKFEVGHE